jgi:hypothetical protein
MTVLLLFALMQSFVEDPAGSGLVIIALASVGAALFTWRAV